MTLSTLSDRKTTLTYGSMYELAVFWGLSSSASFLSRPRRAPTSASRTPEGITRSSSTSFKTSAPAPRRKSSRKPASAASHSASPPVRLAARRGHPRRHPRQRRHGRLLPRGSPRRPHHRKGHRSARERAERPSRTASHRALPVKTALVELSTGNLEAAKRNTRASYSRTDRPKPSTRSWKPWKGGDGWHRPPRAQHRRHRAALQGTKCNGPCCLCSRTIGSPVPTGYVHIDLSPGTPFPVPGRFFVWDGGSRRREAGGNPFGGID